MRAFQLLQQDIAGPFPDGLSFGVGEGLELGKISFRNTYADTLATEMRAVHL
jgi:hypothetical protein